MTHAAQHQALDFGTAAHRDGEKLLTAFPKLDANDLYLFELADSQARYCDTVLDLQDMTKMQDGEAVILRGYHTVGDGGGTILTYDASATDTCDGCLVFDGPGGDNNDLISSQTWGGTGTGRFKPIDQTTRTIRQCGVYGNGTNAGVNTIRFNAALSRSISRLIVPPGDYWHDGTLQYRTANMTVEGCGWSSIIRCRATAISFAATMENDNVTVRKCHFVFDPNGTPTSIHYAFWIYRLNTGGATLENITLEDNIFEAWTGGAMTCWQAANLRILRNVCFNAGDALVDFWVQLDQRNTLIEGNYCLSDSRTGIRAAIDNGEQVTIRNNHVFVVNTSTFLPTAPAYRTSGIHLNPVTNAAVNITDNFIHDTLTDGIYVFGGQQDNEVNISHNVVSKAGRGNSLYTGGIKADNVGMDFRIENNIVMDFQATNQSASIWIDSVGSIANPFVRNNSIFATNASRGVHFEGDAESLDISNNRIQCNGVGINVASAGGTVPRVNIHGNNITQNGNVNGIYVDNAATTQRANVTGNVLKNTGTGTDFSTQAGIVFVEHATSVKDNNVSSYKAGIRCTQNFPAGRTDMDEVEIRNNRLHDCTDNIVVQGADSTALIPVVGNVFSGTWVNVFGGTGINAGVVAHEVDGVIHVRSNGIPTTGTWSQGDVVWNKFVSSTSVSGWVCYAAGSPGSWKVLSGNLLHSSSTAVGSTTHDMDEKDITFTNADDWTISASTTLAVFQTNQRLHLFGTTSTISGLLSLYDDNDSNYCGWQAPDSVTSNYNCVMPGAQPASPNLVMAVSSGEATSVPVLDWVRTEAGLDDIGNITGSTNVDFTADDSNNKLATCTGNVTFGTLTGTTNRWHTLILKSDTGASRTLTWPAVVKGSPPTSVTSTSGVPIRFFYDGTNWLYAS